MSYEQALEGLACQCECVKKKLFLTNMVWLWRNSNLYFAHFQKKMPFEISSSKKSYFWTRTVHTNQLLGFVLIVTFENSNFSWKCESKKIFIYMSLKKRIFPFLLAFSFALDCKNKSKILIFPKIFIESNKISFFFISKKSYVKNKKPWCFS
jgi:hypothetical protein